MDDKKNLSLIVVAVAIGVLYFTTTQFMNDDDSSSSSESAQTEEGEAETESAPENSDSDSEDASPATQLSAEQLAARPVAATIRTEDFEADIDDIGGGIRAFRITGDPRFTDDSGAPLDVLPPTNTLAFPQYEALRVQLAHIGIPEHGPWEVEQVSEREVRMRWEGNGVRVTRSLRAGDGPYQIWHTIRITNVGDEAIPTRLELESWHYVGREDESSGFISMASRSPNISAAVCVFGDESERKARDDLTEHGVHGYGNGDVHIAAVENVYFTHAMAATDRDADRCAISADDRFFGSEDPHGTLFHAQLLYPWVTIEPGGEEIYRSLSYLGPKDRAALTQAGHGFPQMIDLGFFSLIANQLARLLSFIQGFIPNWGLAIILLTLMIRLVLFPLTNLSFKSMARMRRLKPEMDRINERFKDDAENKGAAMMALYKKHKINPLAGCLPSLVQLPVWWALYTSLSTNIELFHMPFTLWWTDLSSPDPFYVLPVMLGLLMHLQQRLTPTNMDPTQAKMMMYFMPIMITGFMLFLPSGLCLYMLTNSALGIGQMRFNEYRLNKEAENAEPIEPEDYDTPDAGDGSEDSSRPQKRRPRRKRRVRRGRA